MLSRVRQFRVPLPELKIGQRPVHRAALAFLVVAFLVIFASRISRLNDMNMQADETWSIWITLGDLRQTIQWTGYDWPPGYFVLLHGWRALTGISPFSIRASSVLTMLLCAALIYRVTRKLCGERAGLLAVLAVGALGYTIYLSTLLRGYLLNMTLFLLALWLAMLYFETERPKWWRGILIALVFSGMFYIHFTAAFGMAMIGLVTLLMYPPRRITRWILPGIITAVLCLPELMAKLYVVQIKNRMVDQFMAPMSTPDRLLNHYWDYVGQQPILWAALFLIASALLIDRFRIQRRTIMLVLWMLAPFALIWVTLNLDAFNARHLAWIMAGVAIWIGWGLSLLPRPALAAVSVVLAVMMFDQLPLPGRYEALPRAPMVTTFRTLRDSFRNGDVLLRDLTCQGCIGIGPEEWDYMTRVYFPNGGVTFVDAPVLSSTSAPRRIWYISTQGKETRATWDQLEKTRALTQTFGQDGLIYRLYEAPPDPTGILFENGMRLNGVELLNDGGGTQAWKEGDTVRVRLWWSADKKIDLNYSEAVLAWDAKLGVLAQVDAAPQVINGPRDTSQWQPGQYYVEERTLKLPYPLANGNYSIFTTVYQYWDNKRISAPGVNADTLLPIGTIYVKSWSHCCTQ